MENTFYPIKGFNGDVKIMLNVLPAELSDIKRYDDYTMMQHEIVVYGIRALTPRLVTAFGDKGVSYSYSNSKVVARAWTPFLLKVKKRIELVTGLAFNFVLVNKYRDGNDYIGSHSDDEKELRGPIVSLTIGCVRDFILKNKQTNKSTKIPLPHNSCLVFGEKTNRKYYHSLPKRKRCTKVRYNLTFRHIVN